MVRKYTDCQIKLIPSNANSLFKVTYKKDYFSALGMIRQQLIYKSLFNDETLKTRIDLTKFNSNLISLNKLDVDCIEFKEIQSNRCDILFLFSTKLFDIKLPNLVYNHLILIFLFLTETDRVDLMISFNSKFMLENRMTILFSLDNAINNPIFYDKIKLVCSNFKSMIGQFILI